MKEKIRVCVIFGGMSPEHDISEISVTSILNNLDREKYTIYPLGITKDGKWYLYSGKTENIIGGKWLEDEKFLKRAIISPDAEHAGIILPESGEIIKIDIVFPVLHGEFGEDGTIQGLFELAGLKYVGMGVLASVTAMDKTYTKIIMNNAGIPQADWVIAKTWEFDRIDKIMDEAEKKLGYPCFVKPANTGSSVGVAKAYNREELENALHAAAEFDRKILIEEFIDGHEVECSVLGNENPKAGEVGEIMPTVDFYDFDAKYSDESTKLQIPANLPEDTRAQIRTYAVKAFEALGGAGLSRVDFFVKYSDNSVILNEINTMPGFTSISMYPKLWQAMGMSYSGLLDELIELGLKRVRKQ